MDGNQRFLNAKDISEIMTISKSMAYKIIRQLNDELQKKGYITLSGKVPRKYFEERTYSIINDSNKEAYGPDTD